MAEGFLGRWSQRKRAVAAGQPVPEPQSGLVVTGQGAGQAASAQPVAQCDPAQGQHATGKAGLHQDGSPTPVPPPTLADAQALSSESDFKPFVASNVTPEVKNAAMKKLFADPHFNRMDRLDIYIDDYSKPDLLPEAMLRQMASAQFLGLFDAAPDDQKNQSNPAVGQINRAQAAPEIVATATPAQDQTAWSEPPYPQPSDPHHADPDLRLQPNHAAGAQEPGGCAP